MNHQTDKPQPPLTLTIDDITQTRVHQTGLTMRFDRDPDTTARLRKVIRLDAGEQPPRLRRLLQWLKRIRQARRGTQPATRGKVR